MTKLQKSGDEKVLRQLSRDGNQKAADFNLPETEDLETEQHLFEVLAHLVEQGKRKSVLIFAKGNSQGHNLLPVVSL
ncbi:hypothetical protein EYF80_003565 [Liparis tanakae]|uniref:Uncharacterized protein n=1 Tax=Liparis tanakae TaxID=230148 RepID=A0A4Z2J8X2_9TELE|nr:hypothetical protein EYF80_003565 [Liparis tanakae]